MLLQNMKEKQMLDKIRSKYHKSIILPVIFCFLVILCISGCSGVSRLKKQTKKVGKILRSDSHLNKKAAVLLLSKPGSFSTRPFQKMFQLNLFESLKDQCSDVILMFPGENIYPKQLLELPRNVSGNIDNFALVSTAKKLGLNSVIIVRPLEIEATEKEKGFWLMRDTHYFGIVQTDIEVYNIATGAKLLHKSLDQDAEISGTDFDSVKSGRINDIYELDEAAEDIAEQAGELVCEVIDKQPWQGYVVSVNKNKILLSSGRESGLAQGDILDVFENIEIIKGKNAQQFFVPGQKIGEIRLNAVFVGKSEAVLIKGTIIKAGYTVRVQ